MKHTKNTRIWEIVVQIRVGKISISDTIPISGRKLFYATNWKLDRRRINMDFYDVVKSRRSIRSYKSDAIDREALGRICEAVRWAPSACNIQPWMFRIVLNREIRNNICSVYKGEWLKKAPGIVLALGNRDVAWKRVEGNSIIDVDIGIAMEHLILAAAAEGLSTCWICAFDVKKMGSVTGVLPPWEVLAISPLGKAAQIPDAPKRKPSEEIFKIIE